MKKGFPLVSIVVPAFRVEYFIADLIDNLSKILYPNLEVLMIFDPFPDKSVEIARERAKNLKNFRMIANSKHLGISKSLNLGIKKSRGKYVVFFMTDMYVDPLCVGELVNFINNSDKSIGAVVSKIYDYHKRNRIQTYRMYFMPQTGFLFIPEYGLKDGPKYNKPFEGFSGIDGTMFKKEVFQKAGMLDTDIDAGINDLDMIWRTWLAGFKVIRIPSAKIYHWSLKEGRSTVKWEFSYARMMDVFIQNYSMKYLLLYLPQLLAVYTARGLITIIQGNPKPLKGLIKAIFWSIGYLPQAFKKRKIIQSRIRKVSDDYLHEKIFGKLSLWEFYKHLKWTQENITPIMLTKEAGDERVITFSK